ncbi:DUF968 domain-containing protein [Xanthobacter autotrophicus]|uniref:DUF968 domain-containing protein n=2 Tax=Xanthobacter autotrophicus TaxID=280 RepID=A0A6C1KIV9_XANAU|nr:DUF968 domain-containing protein [Xanthobacter autotrophicus]
MALRIVPEGGWPPIPQKTAHPDRARKPARERGRQEDPAHLALIRKLPCLVTGSRERIEAAHIRMSDAAMGKRNAGVGAKPSDCWTVPLSAEKHREQHEGNERWFWERHGINPLRVAERLYDLSVALRGLGRPEAEIVQALTAIVNKARAEATGEPIGRGK